LDGPLPFSRVAFERKIYFLNFPALGRISEFGLGIPVPQDYIKI
jgi:hypothetical protein